MNIITRMINWVSGRYVKTVANESIFGSGNIAGGSSLDPGDGIRIQDGIVSAKVDNSTIGFDSNGNLKALVEADVTKQYVDDQDQALQNQINNKSDKTDTYTKNEVDTELEKKLTANGADRGLDIANNKVGHTNSITSPSTTARFICGVLDEEGHFKGTPVAFQYSAVYNSDLENCLFTRTGAYNLYNFVKIKEASGGNAVLTTGMDSALTRTSSGYQSTVSRIMKYCGVISLQYFGQYSASAPIIGKFTCIGSVPADYKPVSKVAITVITWNATPAGGASGYVDTDGKIYVWISSIESGQTNIQFVINANWKSA